MVRPGLYVAVGLGSAIGALLRFACSLWLATPDGSLPPATLLVNITGSFWIGCYVSLTGPDGCWRVSDWQKQFMLSGVCAGFTTFSVFSLEFMQLLQAGQILLASGYVVLSLILWLLACLAGLTLGSRINRGRSSDKGANGV
ncbi:fluoride efflux transporter FluC [Arsukibacterium indicum]|uniref:Fluoride-specific ion channel FluC n=1 Tax=Arsukibacterium indicum TaxID=2848612 RepID=A0ABS6MF79_9GAMM|nr:CrcB family protein [Arsukibacterium indicum]MBV2127479.1 CrcB family protein [Arsukibacterium indicum]